MERLLAEADLNGDKAMDMNEFIKWVRVNPGSCYQVFYDYNKLDN